MSRRASNSEDESRAHILKWMYYAFSNDSSIFLSIKIMKHHADSFGSKTNLEIGLRYIEIGKIYFHTTKRANMMFIEYLFVDEHT